MPKRSSTRPPEAVSEIDPVLKASVNCSENGDTNSLMLNSNVTLSESDVVIIPCMNEPWVNVPWLVVSVSVSCVTSHVETSTYSSKRRISCLWSGLLGVNLSRVGGVISAVKTDTIIALETGIGMTKFPAVSEMVRFCIER